MKVWYQLYFGSDRIGRATQAEVDENINVDDFCQVVLEKRAQKLNHVNDAADLNVLAPNADPNDSDAALDPRKAILDILESNEDTLIVQAPSPHASLTYTLPSLPNVGERRRLVKGVKKEEERRRLVKGVKKEEERPAKKEQDIEDDRPEQVVSKTEENSGGGNNNNDIQLEPPCRVSSSLTRTTPARRSKRNVLVSPDGPTGKRRKSEDAVVGSENTSHDPEIVESQPGAVVRKVQDDDTDDPPVNENQPDEVASTGQGADEPNIKVEKVRLEIKEQRKYGDRFLIGRHEKDGIPRLGGNWQGTYPYPKPPVESVGTAICRSTYGRTFLLC
jgi:hypothetical protein